MAGKRTQIIDAEMRAALQRANVPAQAPEAGAEPLYKQLVDAATGVRGQVSDTPSDAPATAPARKAELPEELKPFAKVVLENRKYKDAVDPLVMVSRLLQVSYRQGGVDIADFGFDRDNLQDLARGVMSQLHGRIMPASMVKRGLRTPKRLPLSFIYEDLLALQAGSDERAIRERMDTLVAIMEPLDELMGYEAISDVMATIKKCSQEKDPAKIKKIIKDAGFDGTPRLFDQADIPKLLDEADMIVRSYIPTGNGQLNAPILRLRELAQVQTDEEENALLEQYFGGRKLDGIKKKLNALFPEVPYMDEFLMAALREDDFYTAFAKAIAKNCNVKDAGELERKMEAVYDLFCTRYPNALGEDNPVRLQMDAALMQLYKGLWEKSRETVNCYWTLGKALAMDEAEYDRIAKDTIFDGKSQSEVMEAIDSKTTPGFADMLKAAARNTDDSRIDLLKAVALAYELQPANQEDAKRLEAIAKSLATILGKIFPPLLT